MSKKLRIVGLVAFAVCAFSAYSAVAAQAAPNWTVKGAELVGTEKISQATTVTKFGSETSAVLRLVVPEFLDIKCTALEVINGTITGPKTDTAERLKFSGCTVEGPKTESTVCTVKRESGTNGIIETTVPIKSELKRNAKNETFDHFLPEEGEIFVTIKIEGCALAGSYKVIGGAAILPQYNTNATTLEATANQAAQTASGTTLKFGVRNTYLQGTVDFTLQSGNTWGVTP